MARQLFGTDGIRGIAGQYPLDPPTAHAFGAAFGQWVTRHGARPDVVIGMDTRESGSWLTRQVAGGLARVGARPHFAGVITTPGVAYLARAGAFVAGVMISASHNLYQDNGIKVFDHSGYKLPDEEEVRLEEDILRFREQRIEATEEAPEVETELTERYLDYLASTAEPFPGVSMVVDCGHGAASGLATRLFERIGAEVHAVSCSPNGRNINLECGALHPGLARREVLEHGADLGVAFDGDADRAMFVSHTGRIVNGDRVLLLCGRALHEQGKLTGGDGAPVVVATVMSNLGLEQALAAHGIRMLRTPVGDKYVLEEMRRRHTALGGEQCGHVIFREYATTGDGLLTTLRVLAVMRDSGKNLDELTSDMKLYPQRLLNVRVRRKRPLEQLAAVREEIRDAEKAFGDSGRVVVRFSGTEPLARVMVEGADESRVEEFARRIAEAIRKELGEQA